MKTPDRQKNTGRWLGALCALVLLLTGCAAPKTVTNVVTDQSRAAGAGEGSTQVHLVDNIQKDVHILGFDANSRLVCADEEQAVAYDMTNQVEETIPGDLLSVGGEWTARVQGNQVLLEQEEATSYQFRGSDTPKGLAFSQTKAGKELATWIAREGEEVRFYSMDLQDGSVVSVSAQEILPGYMMKMLEAGYDQAEILWTGQPDKDVLAVQVKIDGACYLAAMERGGSLLLCESNSLLPDIYRGIIYYVDRQGDLKQLRVREGQEAKLAEQVTAFSVNGGCVAYVETRGTVCRLYAAGELLDMREDIREAVLSPDGNYVAVRYGETGKSDTYAVYSLEK